jgi:gliding motility-associated-like protein
LSTRHSIVSLILLLVTGLAGIITAQQLPTACGGSNVRYGTRGLPNSTFLWTVDGGTIIANYNDSIDVLWNYDRRSHTITVTEESEFGCFGMPVTASVDINSPVADIGDNQEICQDDQFTFDATTNYSSAVTYLWSDNSTSSTMTTGNPGYVWVRIIGNDGCADYDSSLLTVNPLPVVDLGKDTALCGTSTLLVDAGNFAYYSWSTGDNSSSVTVDADRKEDEPLWVEVTDEKGCVGTDTMILEVCDAYLLFSNIPNTITPGDHNDQNDEWKIPNIELFPDAVLEIYDRWGRLIFRTDDVYNNPWKGETMSGKELPMDAYYYVLDIKLAHTKPVTGYVNLIR